MVSIQMDSLRPKSAHKLGIWSMNFHRSTEHSALPLICTHLLGMEEVPTVTQLQPQYLLVIYMAIAVFLVFILVSVFAVFLRYRKLSSQPSWLPFSTETQSTVAKCQWCSYPRLDLTPPLPLSVSFFHVANEKVSGKAQQVLVLLCVSEHPGPPNIEWRWYFPRIPSSPHFQYRIRQGNGHLTKHYSCQAFNVIVGRNWGETLPWSQWSFCTKGPELCEVSFPRELYVLAYVFNVEW